MSAISIVVAKYKEILEQKSIKLYRSYINRELHNPESTRAEAAIHYYFRKHNIDIAIYEDPNLGGPDFICSKEQYKFLLEVTCIDINAVEKASNLPNNIEYNGGFFNPIDNSLYRKVLSKIKQLSGFNLPTVLAISTEHIWGQLIIDKLAAKRLLTGRDYISFDISDPKTKSHIVTRFENSVFFNLDGNAPANYRNDISAVLLVHITENGLYAIGALNPKPFFPFSSAYLPQIEFMKALINEEKSIIQIGSENEKSKTKSYFEFENA